MRHGNSLDELRDQVLHRAARIVLSIRPLTNKTEKRILGFANYHDPDVCELCLLSELEAWRSA